jgi:response regulator RpfG family c-di-GMP phosphodiesterase
VDKNYNQTVYSFISGRVCLYWNCSGRAAKEAVMAVIPKVLIVDDDRDFRASVKALLESRGYRVLEAESGHDGLQKVVEDPPDVILLDIMM